MIGYLRGEIFENTDGNLIVLAEGGGSAGNGGVGYSVTVPQSPNYLGLLPGKSVELFVHTHVREEAFDLYGFASRIEKEIFLTLLGVNGIGPRVAISILSKVEPESLIRAILEGDARSLTEIPGIGKKTAERLILELADKIRKKMEAGTFAGMASKSAVASGAKSSQLLRSVIGTPSAGTGPFNDAKAALVGLGYRDQDVTALLNRLMAEMPEPPAKAEDLVRTALRQLM